MEDALRWQAECNYQSEHVFCIALPLRRKAWRNKQPWLVSPSPSLCWRFRRNRLSVAGSPFQGARWKGAVPSQQQQFPGYQFTDCVQSSSESPLHPSLPGPSSESWLLLNLAAGTGGAWRSACRYSFFLKGYCSEIHSLREGGKPRVVKLQSLLSFHVRECYKGNALILLLLLLFLWFSLSWVHEEASANLGWKSLGYRKGKYSNSPASW